MAYLGRKGLPEIIGTEQGTYQRLQSPCHHLDRENGTRAMFVAAIMGVNNLVRIDLDLSRGRSSFARRAKRELRRRLAKWDSKVIPAFGRPTGFVVNYDPDRAVPVEN